MKTISVKLTTILTALAFPLVLCAQSNAQLLTSPGNDDTPPPITEQQQTEKKSSDSPKDVDSKDKKSAKKKKAPKEKPDATASGTESKSDAESGKTPDPGKADKGSKTKKAGKKKTEKSDEKTAEESKSDGKNKPAATTNDGVRKAKSTVPLPTRLASFTCGAFLGYPVAFAKRTVHQTKAGNRDFIGESTNPVKIAVATAVSLPFGFVGGLFEGVQYSVYNSWKGSGEEPFSKESFSLGDD